MGRVILYLLHDHRRRYHGVSWTSKQNYPIWALPVLVTFQRFMRKPFQDSESHVGRVILYLFHDHRWRYQGVSRTSELNLSIWALSVLSSSTAELSFPIWALPVLMCKKKVKFKIFMRKPFQDSESQVGSVISYLLHDHRRRYLGVSRTSELNLSIWALSVLSRF